MFYYNVFSYIQRILSAACAIFFAAELELFHGASKYFTEIKIKNLPLVKKQSGNLILLEINKIELLV